MIQLVSHNEVFYHLTHEMFYINVAADMMKHSSVVWLAGCLYCVTLVSFIQAELFTAVVDLERILHAEYEVAQDLRNYIDSEQQRIDTLKRYCSYLLLFMLRCCLT